MPLLIDLSDEGLHAHTIERVVLGKLIYSKFYFCGLAIGDLEVKPLSESMSICILSHEDPVFRGGHPQSH